MTRTCQKIPYKTITQLMKDNDYDVRLFGKSHVKPENMFNWDCEYKNDKKIKNYHYLILITILKMLKKFLYFYFIILSSWPISSKFKI